MTQPPSSTDVPQGDVAPTEFTPPLRVLLGTLLPANIAMFMVWGATASLLLSLQIQDLDPDNKEANLSLVLTVGALCAMIAQPLAGVVSDRTRSRFGPRAPWIVGGSLVGGLALIGMGLGTTIWQIMIAWIAVQIAYNFAQGPLSAILPDRVPSGLRGSFSAIIGLGVMLGMVGGQMVGAMFARNIPTGYMVFAGIALVALTLFVVINPDKDNRHRPRERFVVTTFLRGFWVNPIKHPDFFWTFTGRLLLNAGYLMVSTYSIYILQDYIGVTAERAVQLTPQYAMLSMGALLISTLISGPLSDRLKRRRVFIVSSSIVLACALCIPLLMPTEVGMGLFSLVSGLGFGMFQAVDTALISEVLPSKADFAKDLGVINIAATLPQTLAPALAGVIALSFGYVMLFPIGILLVILGGIAVIPVRSVR
ncbi:MFS transporter [Mycetocola tolaasinivorans]|uniref:MFS transporter n=1 Tax=Mycetocola tolaasinivorans TaxID=76635 RepID=A0A3L6ZYH7_9MICO|nr:MFS transporter [Mycetocola tolaasinivorans]RLP72780.1 MFS transporter [Mycetocola tolaasinivorans]